MRVKLSDLLWLGVALALLIVCPAGAGVKKPAEKKPDKREEASVWMKKKLEHSQKILAGLTKGDFDLVKSSAQSIQLINYLEEWDRADLPEYKRQLQYFSDATKELIRQAEKKNVSGATLAYTQVTLSCVQCHTVIRDVKKK
jgi:cytochrome c556